MDENGRLVILKNHSRAERQSRLTVFAEELERVVEALSAHLRQLVRRHGEERVCEAVEVLHRKLDARVGKKHVQVVG